MIEFASHPQWPAVQFVAQRLRAHHYQALLAGGCVRDALLGREPKDFDLATDARPETVETLFENTVSVGKQFGVIVVPVGGSAIEVATFRKDGEYQDGRRPLDVVFSTAQEDALRRDFTVNALFYDLDKGQVLDYVGGQGDLKRRLLKAVGNPSERFNEDKLRILRALRFQSQLGFELESETRAAIALFSPHIRLVSSERIREEMTKLLKGEKRSEALETLREVGLLSVLFPEVEEALTAPQAWRTWLARLKLAQGLSAEGLWSLFFRPGVKKASLEWLKFSNREFETIVSVLTHLPKIATQAEWTRHELMRFLAQPWARVLLDVYEIECRVRRQSSSSAQWYRKQARELLGEPPKLPEPLLKGSDLIAAGLKPGPRFGPLLEEAFNLQLDGGLQNRQQALEWLKRYLRSFLS